MTIHRAVLCLLGIGVLIPQVLQPAQATDADLVRVTNAGNPDDAHGSGYGGVAYEYSMGKYEVTNAEYCAFLNSKLPTGTAADTYGLYNPLMGSSPAGGIVFTDIAPGGAKFTTKPGASQLPVVYVCWYDAIRYANWLTNGQGTGDTETGGYTILSGGYNSGTVLVPTTAERMGWASPRFVLPTEDEWYKAAWYDPSKAGAPGYWDYATRTDTRPVGEPPPGSANSANYGYAVNALTNVGAYSAAQGAYGTFDQNGNVWEWAETMAAGLGMYCGGSWRHGAAYLPASSFLSHSGQALDFENSDEVGFRVALVPGTELPPLPTIQFAGRQWDVEHNVPRSTPYDSGSPESVWTDSQGRLHLKIRRSGDGNWLCAEVMLPDPLGYGRYLFKVATNTEELHAQTVAAMFLYQDDNHEIDVEMTRWNDPNASYSCQFVTQPPSVETMKRFKLDLAGDYSTHFIDWLPDSIYWQSNHGHYDNPPSSKDAGMISSFFYDRTQGDSIPTDGNVHISFWIYTEGGAIPVSTELTDQEIVIADFRFLKMSDVANSRFALGTLAGWAAGGQGVAEVVVDPNDSSNQVARLTTGSAVSIWQDVDILESEFFLRFDHRFMTGTGNLEVWIDGGLVAILASPGSAEESLTKSEFAIGDANLLGRSGVELLFRLDGPAGSSMLIDNVEMIEVPEPSWLFLLTVLAAAVRCGRHKGRSMDVTT
ncbi:MAG TPA: SUMF1/EgtB/PvdO family nonheme iron enzyme [Phycisphaerae bacterium]|nr:SUMF1/EgtB/PvdO family nonheme iron enzyme [Phycisphaerae bacterium]